MILLCKHMPCHLPREEFVRSGTGGCYYLHHIKGEKRNRTVLSGCGNYLNWFLLIFQAADWNHIHAIIALIAIFGSCYDHF